MKPIYTIPCPKCGATADEPCRTVQTRRVTDNHVARMNAYYSPKRAVTK